ncbi:MAG: GNAT family N-acetyltransferase [Treponema sp.]|nr:GNAT family N-acetyltransferase [Treponema sp.]
MDITFRHMNPEEAADLKKLGRKSFGPLEALFVPTPKVALVAVMDEKIVGGFVYDLETIDDKKIGIASFLFTDPAFHGQGIGKRLCEEGIRYLWEEEGCDALVTFVRDDNVASWGLFKKNGFVLASLPKLAKFLGLPGLAKLCTKTTFGLFAIGHDFYVAMRNEESTRLYGKKDGPGQVAAYVLINMLFLLLLFFVLSSQNIFYMMASGTLVLSGVVLAGYIGTLFSKRKWGFRFTNGGGLIYLIINLAARRFFPLIGNWYPLHYENTPRFKRDIAVNAIAVWVFLLGLVAAGVITYTPPVLLTYASGIASALLIYRCLPVAVFGSSGFWRVFKWNKIVLGLLVVASILVVFVL